MRRVALPFLLVLLSACGTDRVPLSHRLEPGLRLEHRLTLRASVVRTLAGETRSEEVLATFRAAQELVGPAEEGGVEAAISLVPEGLEVNGQPVDIGPAQEYTVRLAPDGRVVAVQVAAGEGTEVLEPVGIERLLPRLQPVLPGRPVGPGDSWRSETQFTDEQGRFALSTRSRLTQLGVADGREAALVRTTYESPVDRQEVFANAVAQVRGSDVGAQEAWFALDGYLVRAVGDSVGTYRVTFTPPAGEEDLAPVRGALRVALHLEMHLLSATPGA
ncbi:MAG: hypothetical protein ACRDHH_03095 [Actinomycetota bacterium]